MLLLYITVCTCIIYILIYGSKKQEMRRFRFQQLYSVRFFQSCSSGAAFAAHAGTAAGGGCLEIERRI